LPLKIRIARTGRFRLRRSADHVEDSLGLSSCLADLGIDTVGRHSGITPE